MKHRTRTIKFIGIMLLILAASFICSQFFFQLALIQGDSMEPSLHNLQLVLIDKRPKKYDVGNIVVFHKQGVQGLVIKRVVANSGDSVLIKDGVLYVNDTSVSGMPLIQEAGRAFETLTIQENSYFLIGDNVNHSIDSRSIEIGDVPQEQILGCVVEFSHPKDN